MRIIVTGGNSGVGKETATALAAAGHSVLIAARDIPKAERAAADMAGDVEVAHLDLADLTSVRKFADSVDDVDVLVNNAGVLGLPLSRTADGFETHMGTNYLGHFALTCLLGDRITDRVVSVTSMNHAFSHDASGRPELAHPPVLEVGRLRAVQARGDALHRRTRQEGCARDRRRSRRRRHQHRPVQRRVSSVGPRKQAIFKDFPQSAKTASRSSVMGVTEDLPAGTYLCPVFKQFGKPRVTKPDEEGARRARPRSSCGSCRPSSPKCDWPRGSFVR